MIQVLIEQPLLLLFLVAAVGYGIGGIKIGSSSLGVSAVLFVGLIIGGMDARLALPDIVLSLGLAMFVYSLGIESGPGFFAIFKGQANRQLSFGLVMVLGYVIISGLICWVVGLPAAEVAGFYSGISTNTASLAGLLDVIPKGISNPTEASQALDEVVVGFSLAYPFGVLGVMLAMNLVIRLFRIDLNQEAKSLEREYPINQRVIARNIRIEQPAVCGIPLRDLQESFQGNLVFGRIKRGEEITLSNWDTTLEAGDIIRIVANQVDLDAWTELAGKEAPDGIDIDSNAYELRRVFVSNTEVAGKAIATLNLPERFSVILSRIRRGDTDLLVKGDTTLELGDQVRFIARRKDIPKLVSLFGDSYRALSHIDLLSFGLGMVLGLLLGSIVFELPGGLRFQLGFAGGPLIVALILGNLRRTGPIVWSLPYSANLTLRQVGLIFLLAAVGVRSGNAFFATIGDGGALMIVLAAVLVTVLGTMLFMVIGYKLFR
ncbi:MAG: TrkA C-terminal domain-containing protein, partial [Bacteroidota bacterium]